MKKEKRASIGGPRSPQLRACCAFLGVLSLFLLMIGVTLTLGTLAVQSIAYPIAGGILIFFSIMSCGTAVVLFICLKRKQSRKRRNTNRPLLEGEEGGASMGQFKGKMSRSETEEYRMTKFKENGGIISNKNSNYSSHSLSNLSCNKTKHSSSISSLHTI